MQKKLQIYLFYTLLLALFASCSVTRHLDEGEILYSKVKINGVNNNELKSGIVDNLRHKPNRRILNTYPFYLQAYNFGLDGRDSTKIRTFFREKVGEEPVLLDSALLQQSIKQIDLYLFNEGYFDAKVNYEVKKRKRSKKAKVYYNIETGDPYKIQNIRYKIYDRVLDSIIHTDTAGRLFRSGDIFDTDKLTDERDRITTFLHNNGYYLFSKDYVDFDIDSAVAGNLVNVAIEIKNPGTFRRHQVFTIEDVYVDIEDFYYDPRYDDSTFIEIRDGLKVRTRGFPIKPEILESYVSIRKGRIYRERRFVTTYNRFYDLAIFRNVNIIPLVDTSTNLIRVFIVLQPNKKVDYGIEPQAITSDQSSSFQTNNNRVWGLANQIQFRNKNVFKGAEIFDITLGTSAEFQVNNRQFFYSNFEQSISSSITIPKLLFFPRMDSILNARTPRTIFNLTFIYENNLDFVRRVALFNYSYTFNTPLTFWRVVPLEISLNQVNFKKDISTIPPGERVLLQNLLNTNFIPSIRLEMIYSNKEIRKRSYNLIKWTIFDWGGFQLNSIYKLVGIPRQSDGYYKVFNVNFYNYIKTDVDVRHYIPISEDLSIAYRTRGAIAFPYGNARIIPFEKRFFIGGANSLRGWRPRNLGPGSYYNPISNQIDRSGEILLEGSFEFRFKMIPNLLNGALFFDAGNIWNVYADTVLKNADFKGNRFYKEFALNTGIGFRFDFSFFIIRLDFGAQLRDPSYPHYNRWVLHDMSYLTRRVTANFGIGYPF